MIYLTLVLAFMLGFWMREVLVSLKRIIAVLERLRLSEKKKPQQQQTSFAEPMTRAEVVALIEQERVDALNQL